MNRHVVALILTASLCAFSLRAQSARPELFDSKKTQQELEIMRGIIGTTMDFAARESQEERGRSTGRSGPVGRLSWGGHGVAAYYFYGQGATFLVPLSGSHLAAIADFGEQFAEVEEQMKQVQEDYAEAASAYAAAGVAMAATPAPPAPPVPPAPPQAPKPAVAATPRPAPAPAAREDAKKRLAEAQEKVKVRVKRQRELSEERQKEMLETVERAKSYLVEALANHGDSLTFLKPNEYINVVLSTDAGNLLGDSDRENARQILSVQKSAITDYKAGRLSLDAFRQKVLQYTNY